MMSIKRHRSTLRRNNASGNERYPGTLHRYIERSERYFFSSTVYTFIFLLLFDDLEFFMILSEVEAESKEKE